MHPIHRHNYEDRGTYRIHLASAEPCVLRAFRQASVTTTLLKQAAILDYLARCGYPAPRPILTLTRQPVATFQNWSALFTTFIAGTCVDFSYENLSLLAASLGRLHRLTEHVMTCSSTPLLPGSRFQLASAIPYALGQLLPEAHRVPLEMWPLYHGVITALHHIQQTSNLPMTVVHGNSWPANAICTVDGEVVLTSWSRAGIGPAILDVSYLLLISHLEHPERTHIEPNVHAIAAIVRGYCEQRRLTAYEHTLLLDGVRFGIALHCAEHLPAILHGQWRKSTRLKTLQASYDASAGIASLALQYFEQELTHQPW
ncbi:MAG: hypothetical protein NVS2B12_26350 [Ktedonobacteraceae bacterium]